jgi:hypothetical protein
MVALLRFMATAIAFAAVAQCAVQGHAAVQAVPQNLVFMSEVVKEL